MKYFLCLVLLAVHKHVFCCNILESGVNKKDKEIIVNEHNRLRDLVSQGKVRGQPKGLNLKKMFWDDTLASKAQDIADLCQFKHKKVNDRRWKVGQNLYKQSSSKFQIGANWNGAIQAWFDEHKNYRYSRKFRLTKGTGHYTQVVWADTSHIGCGYAYYASGSMYDKLYVCNYGPAGNIKGRLIYQSGRPSPSL
ncbi:hypothetical protein NQ315_008566 [Exocentrus adspersus]|uniref:SCP domain-containing protein n=1 Tax=Exocentrus adspersus TaxID=1586481 RepID=A0AAV8W5N4_9CUCU|nr:hypothetical protein NQ315_008566 [Exocentrus adspersus]